MIQHYKYLYHLKFDFGIESHVTCNPLEYAGASIDAQCEIVTPVRDIINWDRNLAATGCLPDSFPKLLAALRYSTDTGACSCSGKGLLRLEIINRSPGFHSG